MSLGAKSCPAFSFQLSSFSLQLCFCWWGLFRAIISCMALATLRKSLSRTLNTRKALRMKSEWNVTRDSAQSLRFRFFRKKSQTSSTWNSKSLREFSSFAGKRIRNLPTELTASFLPITSILFPTTQKATTAFTRRLSNS